MLVTARIMQGVGAAMLAPATLAVLNTTVTEPGERARVFLVAAALGPAIALVSALLPRRD
ncbi:hypothetical protein ACQHIV_01115 [Kribbella sp. GL6]|uniref:hypothetical protein n=1 Tax=Kribbella sp. GL6 TaxID=3419765 RepID=UPI003CFEAF54